MSRATARVLSAGICLTVASLIAAVWTPVPAPERTVTLAYCWADCTSAPKTGGSLP